jgi:ubiquinone/menaquinone biosynthesis C-methylase UbiE
MVDYLQGLSIEDFEGMFATRFPEMAPALWLRRPGGAELLDVQRAEKNEFESDESGRGDSFRRAHERSSVKATGMSALLELATGAADADGVPEGFRLLDVLGGSGTLVRVTGELPRWKTSRSWILTGDVSSQMVLQALDYGLPAVRQPAQFLLCREEAFDAVLVAYGAHHIPVAERGACYAEALRALRPGGRVVVHDFAVGSPMARWFEEIVDAYSPTGHRYTHFTSDEFEKDLSAAGFTAVEVRTVYDPITVHAETAADARARMLRYVRNSYGLTHPGGATAESDVLTWVEGLVTGCLVYRPVDFAGLPSVPGPVRSGGSLTLYETSGGWVAELPRLAQVAVAVKD